MYIQWPKLPLHSIWTLHIWYIRRLTCRLGKERGFSLGGGSGCDSSWFTWSSPSFHVKTLSYPPYPWCLLFSTPMLLEDDIEIISISCCNNKVFEIAVDCSIPELGIMLGAGEGTNYEVIDHLKRMVRQNGHCLVQVRPATTTLTRITHHLKRWASLLHLQILHSQPMLEER